MNHPLEYLTATDHSTVSSKMLNHRNHTATATPAKSILLLYHSDAICVNYIRAHNCDKRTDKNCAKQTQIRKRDAAADGASLRTAVTFYDRAKQPTTNIQSPQNKLCSQCKNKIFMSVSISNSLATGQLDRYYSILISNDHRHTATDHVANISILLLK